MRSSMSLFFRVLIITLIFLGDVKVKADLVVQMAKGQVEIEEGGKIFSAKDLGQLPYRFRKDVERSIQTFKGTARFIYQKNQFGMGSESLLFSRKDSFDFSKGKLFVGSASKTEKLKIQTPQSLVEATGAEILIEIVDGRTNLNVISGSASLTDRSSLHTTVVEVGCTSWIGGLLAIGHRAHSLRPEAFDFEHVMGAARFLAGWSDSDYDRRVKGEQPLWKDAVLRVGDEDQTAVEKDSQIFHQLEQHQAELEKQKNAREALLRKLFREKTLGVPDQNTELPSESLRFPANDD